MIAIDIEKIILERANQGLTKDELSKRAGVGRQTITRLEKKGVTPNLVTIGKIAKALGKKIEDFRKEAINEH